MKEVGVDVLDLLAGWHLLSRSGAPRRTHIQLKSLCQGSLNYQKVSQALLKMFGGDHKPNIRDLLKVGTSQGENSYLTEEGDEAYFYEDTDFHGEDDWNYDEDVYQSESNYMNHQRRINSYQLLDNHAENAQDPSAEQVLAGIIRARARALDGLPPLTKALESMPDNKWTGDMDLDDDALLVATELDEKHSAWIKTSTSEKAVPMSFLLKHRDKGGSKVANARIILQGFRHSDVTTEKLDTEPIELIMKSVSLLCQILTSDIIRRRLARLIGLRDDEIMRISKPASGDVRAPRQWYSTADLVDTDEMKLARQRLDKCLYLNVRKAVGGDEKFRVFNRNGAAYVVDGICGIHVDDLVSGGEGVNSKADVEQQGPEHFVCYKDRAQTLLHRFPFGSVDFTRNQAFCDIQLEQGMAHDSVAIVVGFCFALAIHNHGDFSELVFGVYTDAAWAVCPDGSLQDRMVIFVASRQEVESGKPFPLTVLDWSSKKLTRVCRSSFSAETQAAANAVDELDRARTVWHLMVWLFKDLSKVTDNNSTGASAITNARSLYDAANSMSAGLKLTKRRCAIELTMSTERLKAMGS
ncbi:unnamed protein product [Symbiodinium pilosum]|uniref:Uncharacterized protein n=1 Tax=Symbiodinium pilosum TaxID=2952 RepID=A0A812SD59_SYMPI|nr:unnamed protein product [Symbiodinium pilosum]